MTMDLNLSDKVIIISGGAKGIGKAIVNGLADEGSIPVILDKDEKASQYLKDELIAKGKSCHFICGDLRDIEFCKKSILETLEKFGRIDGIINNAGNNDGAGLMDGIKKFKTSLELNLYHYYALVHYALESLKISQGSIVNISSKTAITGQGGTSGYVASKGAILALTREWALELLPFNIRVNAVIPAEVMTPLYADWLSKQDNPEQKKLEIESKIPLGNRMTKAEEIASACLFLLSEKSAHTTGQWHFVDGGYTHLDRAIS